MAESPLSLTAEEQSAMLRLARLAIRSHWHPEFASDITAAQAELTHGQQPLACFVTLHEEGALRGCIGCLEAEQPLAAALVYFAQAAAFSDPRFPPLQETELDLCQLSISLLGPLSPIPASSRQQVLAHLIAHRDGLWLQSPGHRATFLPAVWRELPDADQFLNQLLRKGGWPIDSWPSGLSAFCYQTVEFADPQ
ncbi:MAG: AmmeMemoRadiSam system protein A [Aeromonadaceae bacterium]|nr:AmmeMemoRadiSam system protein A [Aeromonadaceae bacterium]